MVPKVPGHCRCHYKPRICKMNIWKVLFIFTSVIGIAYINHQWILPTYCPSLLQLIRNFGSAAKQAMPSNLRRPGKLLGNDVGSRHETSGSTHNDHRGNHGAVAADTQVRGYQYEGAADGNGYKIKEVDLNVHVKTKQEEEADREAKSLIEINKIQPHVTRPDLVQNRIVFLKTHRTGSSTVTCLIKRYGLKHELLFALPKELRAQNFLQTVKFRRTFVYQYPGVENQKYDILANNARYNKKEMEFVVPKATFITILRRPEEQFESVFGFYNITSKLNLTKSPHPIAAFLERAEYYYGQQDKPYSNFLKNGQLFDLGLDRNKMVLNADIVDKIKTLETEFDLVMIREYFDESLLLLRKLLGWKIEDILYISSNIRSDINRYQMDQPLREKIARWNNGDVELYDHFNKTLWWRMKEYGPTFEKDLATFRAKNQEVFERCVDTSKSDNSDKRQKKFVARDSSKFCQDLLRSDNDFVFTIRQKQKEMFRRN